MIQIATRVTEEEKQEIELFCKKHDIKIAQLIRWAIREYLDQNTEITEK